MNTGGEQSVKPLLGHYLRFTVAWPSHTCTKLRSAHLLPIQRACAYFQVPIIYTLRFNPLPAKVKINHLSLSPIIHIGPSFGNQNGVLYLAVIAVSITAFFGHSIHWLFQSICCCSQHSCICNIVGLCCILYYISCACLSPNWLYVSCLV